LKMPLRLRRRGNGGVIIKDEYFRIIREAGFDAVRIPIRRLWDS